MADLYLQDSSFWIRSRLRSVPARIGERSRALIASGEIAINEVIRLEILAGYKTRDEVQTVADELEALRFLPINRAVWDVAELLGFNLLRTGFRTPLPDLVIAATAIHYGATLLHADSDFERIGAQSDLKTESYLGTT